MTQILKKESWINHYKSLLILCHSWSNSRLLVVTTKHETQFSLINQNKEQASYQARFNQKTSLAVNTKQPENKAPTLFSPRILMITPHSSHTIHQDHIFLTKNFNSPRPHKTESPFSPFHNNSCNTLTKKSTISSSQLKFPAKPYIITNYSNTQLHCSVLKFATRNKQLKKKKIPLNKN